MEIPARLSVYEPDYDPALGYRLDIALDGVRQADVVAYDVPAGEILQLKRDASGNYVTTEAGNEIVVEALTGIVTVTLRDTHDQPRSYVGPGALRDPIQD